MTKSELVSLARVRRLAKSGAAQSIRLGAGLSLAELGSGIEPGPVGPSTVFRWETGQRTPSGDKALGYLAVLDALVAASA